MDDTSNAPLAAGPVSDRPLTSAEPTTFGIVTPTLNAERYLERTLDSIWSQVSDEVAIDHVLVDGGSTDRTVEIARRYPTRVIVAPDDRGMYDAINHGLSIVQGAVVGYLNADDELTRGALGGVARAFRRHPEALWLMGRREYVDADGRLLAPLQPVPFTLAQYVAMGWSHVPQECTWLRRELYERVGPFDITFRNTGDYDMFARCRAVAAPLIVSQTLGRFRLHGDQLSYKPDIMALESARVREKNGGGDRWTWVRGRYLSLRVNGRNPRFLLAKKIGKISFTPE
jgi:glycosyltransferase involved in cell wall biosynthesis